MPRAPVAATSDDLASQGVEAADLLVKSATICFLVCALLVFSMSMHKTLDVDENGFIASGVVLSRQGALPYRDYHYNHMPTEVLVYVLLFKLSGHLLLIARAFQSLCAAGAVTALFVAAYGAFDGLSPRPRVGWSACIALLLLANPLFTQTAGLAWNHDFPLLMALLAFLALRRGLRQPRPAMLTVAAGFLLAVSVTSRLTFAPTLAGFVLLIGLYPRLMMRRRVGLLALFGLGFLLASLPSIWIWAQAPQNAFFGNFLYPRLNTRIHAIQERGRPLTTLPIMWFYFKTWLTLPGSGIVTIGFLALIGLTLRPRQVRTDPLQCELLALSVIVVLLIASGFMPAPPYVQYFYAATPFMILGIALCLGGAGALPREVSSGRIGDAVAETRINSPILSYAPAVRAGRPRWNGRATLLGATAFCTLFALPSYRGLFFLPRVSQWVPMGVHETGRQVAAVVGSGKVLTIEPIFPLEGGLKVDPRFSTGRFGVRTAGLLSAEQRRRYLMPDVREMAALLDGPDVAAVAIVMGSDWRIDGPLAAAARARGYRQVILNRPAHHAHPHPEVWVNPAPRRRPGVRRPNVSR